MFKCCFLARPNNNNDNLTETSHRSSGTDWTQTNIQNSISYSAVPFHSTTGGHYITVQVVKIEVYRCRRCYFLSTFSREFLLIKYDLSSTMRFRIDELEVFFPYDRMYLEPSNKLLIRRAVHFSRCLPELVKLRCLLSLITCNVPASYLPICKFKCWKIGILYTNRSWNECSNGRIGLQGEGMN